MLPNFLGALTWGVLTEAGPWVPKAGDSGWWDMGLRQSQSPHGGPWALGSTENPQEGPAGSGH